MHSPVAHAAWPTRTFSEEASTGIGGARHLQLFQTCWAQPDSAWLLGNVSAKKLLPFNEALEDIVQMRCRGKITSMAMCHLSLCNAGGQSGETCIQLLCCAGEERRGLQIIHWQSLLICYLIELSMRLSCSP